MFLGDLLLALLFVVSGLKGFMNLKGFSGLIASKSIPFPGLVAIAVLSLKVLGGFSIAMNDEYSLLYTKGLLVFMALATILYHNVFVDPSQLNHALKNIAVIGGLLYLLKEKDESCKEYLDWDLLN